MAIWVNAHLAMATDQIEDPDRIADRDQTVADSKVVIAAVFRDDADLAIARRSAAHHHRWRMSIVSMLPMSRWPRISCGIFSDTWVSLPK